MSETATAPLPTPAQAPDVKPEPAQPEATLAPEPEPEAPALTVTPTKVEEPTPTATVASAPTATVTTTSSDATAATITPIPDMTSKPEPSQTPTLAKETPAPAPTAAPAQESKTEEEEPQNTLTKQFTNAEWKALKEFRSDLPNIFVEAFPDKSDANSTPITIWGVTLDPRGKKDARASVVLMKFLRARNLNPTAAREMLVGTLRWRESFDIAGALKEEFPEEIFGPLGKTFGYDKGKRPVVYNLYGGNPDIKAVFSDVQRFIRWRVAFQERCVALLDFNEVDQMIQIHDYEGVGFSSRDANSKAAAGEATNIFQNHYPEMLYKKFFINVPTILSWIFWAFKPIIPAATLAKMSVVGTGQSTIHKALVPHIDDLQLPRRYGGGGEAGF